MKVDIKILEEIKRYNQINSYIFEQELPPPPAGGEVPPPIGGEALPPAPGTEVAPPPPAAPTGTTEPTPVDISNDPDVEELGDEKTNKKELEVTDLVKSQQSVEEKQEQYFENLFSHLNDLEEKLSSMDQIIDKLNSLETKIEKYRVKTPEEKLELRSLDSGPFNQKLSQFFEDKEEDLEKSGKNEYILTTDEVENYSPNDIKKSFRNFEDVVDTDSFNNSSYQKNY
jgi:hypothetical protein